MTMTLTADAIVVLGCAVKSNGQPSAAMRRRVRLASRAFDRRVAPFVVVSGGRRHDGHMEAEVMRRELVRCGVDPDSIFMETRSLNTVQNAFFSSRLLERKGWARVLLITQQWHMPRALRDFRRFEVDAMQPPASWYEDPRAPLMTRLRELASDWVDSMTAWRMR